MAKLTTQIVKWQVPTDPSVVSHKLYYCPEQNILSYDSPYVEVFMPICEFNLSTLPINANGEMFKLALTAMDEVGNESNMSVEKVLPLDILPPNAPIWLQ